MGSSQRTLECSCHPPLSLVSLYILDYGFDPREHHQLLSKVDPVSRHRTFGHTVTWNPLPCHFFGIIPHHPLHLSLQLP